VSALGVRRGKAALSSACETHPATAPAGSNRSNHGGNEVAGAFGYPGLDPTRSVATRVASLGQDILANCTQAKPC
jgi:hypothetical protein